MSRTYAEKYHNLGLWVEITAYHWQRLKGQLHNDPEFWADTFYAFELQDWWDLLDVAPVLKLQYPELYIKYSRLDQDLAQIQRRLMLGKPVIKPMAKNHNLAPFRAWMAFKDLINDVRGTPTVQTFEEPEPEPQFFKLFDIK
jgi:hypothetical protein